MKKFCFLTLFFVLLTTQAFAEFRDITLSAYSAESLFATEVKAE